MDKVEHGLPESDPSEAGRRCGRTKRREYGTKLEWELKERKEDLLHAKRLRQRESTLHAEWRRTGTQQAQFLAPPRSQLPHSSSDLCDLSPNQDDDNFSDDEGDWKKLYYALHLLHFGLSISEVKRTESLMEVLYDSKPSICYELDVHSLLQKQLEIYDHSTYYYCNNCNATLNGSRGVCRTLLCPLYKINVKRAKATQRVEVHVVNMIPQLKDIIADHLEEIVRAHHRIHHSQIADERSRSDVRLYPGFAENIETAEEFESNRLRLLLTISTDGFQPKRITRRCMWPLYLRVDDIDEGEANKFENSILCGAIYGKSKPIDTLVDNLLSRLVHELADIERQPIAVHFSGIVWRISASIYRGVADMEAQRTLFGIPRWNSKFGCSKCYLRGRRIARTRVWFADEEEYIQLRTTQSYLDDGETQQHGIEGVTPAMKLMKPCIFSSDALHVCSEGITKARFRDLFNGASRFPGLRIGALATERVKRSLQKTSSHTYANSIVLSLEDLPNCSGSEIDEIAFVAFPLLAAVCAIRVPVAAASLLGYWLSLRIMAKTAWLTVDSISIAQIIADYTKKIWVSMAPITYTMKCHWYFDHAMKDELERFGTTYQWSSSPFEKHHRRLQIKVNQTTTNCSKVVIERFLLSKRIQSMARRRCTQGTKELRRLLDVVENRHVKRFPVHIVVSEDMYIPRNSSIEDLLNKHRCFVRAQNGDEPFSRLVLRGKVYSSEMYWKRSRSSRQDVVVLRGANNDRASLFGSIQLFVYNRRNITVVLDEFVLADPFEKMGNLVNQIPHDCRRLGLQLMRLIGENNCFFKQVTEQVTRRHDPNDIMGPACLVQYGSARYVSVL